MGGGWGRGTYGCIGGGGGKIKKKEDMEKENKKKREKTGKDLDCKMAGEGGSAD